MSDQALDSTLGRVIAFVVVTLVFGVWLVSDWSRKE